MEKEARIYAEMACVWIRDHKSQWAKLRRIVRKCRRQGMRVSRDTVFTIAQYDGMPISEVKEFCRDHNMWAPLSRYMLMLEPSLSASIRPKTARIDTVDLEQVYRDTVNKGVFFFAKNWREARELYEMQDVAA